MSGSKVCNGMTFSKSRPPVTPAWWGGVAVFAACSGLAAGGEPAALRPVPGRPMPTGRPAAKVDAAVMPAGGTSSQRCSQCDRAACPHCRQTGGPRPHGTAHSHCQHGLCPAHCPVRPDVFGFYGTQWRRWPGSGVVPASATDAAAPARPARSQVPSAAEESLPREEDLPTEPAAAAGVAVPEADAASPAREEPAGKREEEKTVPDQEEPAAEREDAAAKRSAAPSRTAWRSFTAAAP